MKKFLICCLLLASVFNVTTFALPSDLSAIEPGYIHEIKIAKKIVEPIGALCGVILIIFPFIKLFWLNKKIKESEGEKFKLTGIFALKCLIFTIIFQFLLYFIEFTFYIGFILIIIIIYNIHLQKKKEVENVFEYKTKFNFILTLLLCNVLSHFMIYLPNSGIFQHCYFNLMNNLILLGLNIIYLALMILPILIYKHKIKDLNKHILNENEKKTMLKKSFIKFLSIFPVTTFNSIILKIIIGWLCTPVAKPIIYLYPEKEEKVNVNLENKENLTCTYPKYDNAWEVIAKTNGDLIDEKTGRKFYALYWEGKNLNEKKFEDGFCIKGEDSIKFLEEKLAILGLNERESNEFIVYWLPKLEKNKYNLIRFISNDKMNVYMPLEINPKPDTIIRVMMQFKGINKAQEIKEQELKTVERKGFTVVEWGGTEIK